MRNYTMDVMRRGFGKTDFTDIAQWYLFDNLIGNLKVKYGEELYLTDYGAKKIFCDWIKKYDSKYSKRPNNNGVLTNCQMLVKLDKDTYVFAQIGTYVSKFDFLVVKGDSEDTDKSVKLYIFGKRYKKYVSELRNELKHNNSNELYMYNISGSKNDNEDIGINSIGRIMDKRSLDTLFFNDNIKDTIISHIDNFLRNKHIYEEKNLTFKTGILLYGEPGTGKSSLVKALATEYGYNLIVLDMTTFDRLDVALLTSCINADTDKFIVLLEDIDTLFTSLNRDDNAIEKDEKAVINKMLQFLDSSSSPSDTIFIATTNHIEMLDAALLRDGRFDLKVQIKNIDHDTAVDMVKSFNITDNNTIEKIIAKTSTEETINPAKLQNKILDHFKEEIINEE